MAVIVDSPVIVAATVNVNDHVDVATTDGCGHVHGWVHVHGRDHDQGGVHDHDDGHENGSTYFSVAVVTPVHPGGGGVSRYASARARISVAAGSPGRLSSTRCQLAAAAAKSRIR